jgi:hypothetical protein
LGDLCGLFYGIYGAHGDEILHVTATKGENGDYTKLKGLKITGDPNVPAQKVSFLIDLKQRLNELPHDPRPIILTTKEGAMYIADLADLMSRVVVVFRGTGCINIDPAIWDPEYRPLVYIAYVNSGVVACMLILGNDSVSYRHGIELKRMPNFF